MEPAVDVVWLTRRLWQHRLPMLATFVCVLLCGLAASWIGPRRYRATAEITIADPIGYHKIGAGMRRDLGLPQLRREALAEHAENLSSSPWAEKVLATSLDPAAAKGLAQSVRGVVVRGDAPDATALSLTVSASAPQLASDAANALADAYAASTSAWPEAQLQSALAAVQARRQEIENQIVGIGGQLLEAGMKPQGEKSSARLLIDVSSQLAAEVLRVKAQAEVDDFREQIATALSPHMASADKAAGVASGLVGTALPGESELALRSAERASAARTLSSVAYRGSFDYSDELEEISGALPGVSEGALQMALHEHLARLTGVPVDLGGDALKVSRVWLAARASTIRAEAHQEIGARLRQQRLQDTLAGNHTDALIGRINALESGLARIVEVETLFAAELAGEGARTAVVVSARAVPPARSLAAPLMRRLASALAAASLAALAVGLALQTFSSAGGQQLEEVDGRNG